MVYPRRKYPARRKAPPRRYAKRKTVRRTPIYKRPKSVGIPNSMFVKLRYDAIRQVAIAGTALEKREFSLNSCYDPDITGTGNQPYYFDQYAALYNHYRVFGCKVELKFSTSTSSSTSYHPILCVCPYTAANNWADNIQNMMSSTLAKWVIVVPDVKSYTIKKYYSIAGVAGVPKSAISTNPYWEAAINGNPTINIPLAVWMKNQDASATYTTGIQVQMTYYVKFYDRQMPTQS